MINGVSGSSSFPLCNAHCRWDDTIAPQRRVGVVEKVVTTLAFTTATATSFPHDIEIAQSQDHQTAGSQDGLHPRKSHCWAYWLTPVSFFFFPQPPMICWVPGNKPLSYAGLTLWRCWPCLSCTYLAQSITATLTGHLFTYLAIANPLTRTWIDFEPECVKSTSLLNVKL